MVCLIVMYYGDVILVFDGIVSLILIFWIIMMIIIMVVLVLILVVRVTMAAAAVAIVVAIMDSGRNVLSMHTPIHMIYGYDIGIVFIRRMLLLFLDGLLSLLRGYGCSNSVCSNKNKRTTSPRRRSSPSFKKKS